jgi:hypothetical protein
MDILGKKISNFLAFGKDIPKSPNDGKVVAKDVITISGNIHRKLTKFSQKANVTFIENAGYESESFYIAVGSSAKIVLTSTMELRPSVEIFRRRIQENKELSMTLVDSNNRFISFAFGDVDKAQRWHLLFCTALAEMILTEGLQKDKKGNLSVKRIEKAISRCVGYIEESNALLSRTKRIFAAKVEVQHLLAKLTQDPHSVTREEVRSLMYIADSDPVRVFSPILSSAFFFH